VTDEETRRELAKLIVTALGIGTGRREEISVIREILEKLDGPIPGNPAKLRPENLARDLASAAPTAEALINVVVAVGGRFIDMVNEVYVRLARHAVTIGGKGTAEKIRFQRDGINEQQLTISPAFIERWRELQEATRRTETGWIDESAIESFLGWDGDFYGRWPVDRDDGIRLAAWALALNRTARVSGPDESAALALIAAAERLVRAHITRLETLARTGTDPVTAPGPDRNGYGFGTVRAALAGFTETGLVGMTIYPDSVTGVTERSIIGFDARFQPVLVTTADDNNRPYTPMGTLAAFAAMGRNRLQPAGFRHIVPDRDLPANPEERDSWLRRYRTSCEEAARWLTQDAFRSTGYIDETQLIEIFREFLNLPLWRHRELLYEIWVLCATLDAAEQAGWITRLNGLSRHNDEWVLSVGRSQTPIAKLANAADPGATLEVWREPARQAGPRDLTPDVTVSTPAPYQRDLLVVEAKDRVKMPSGLRFRVGGSGDPPGGRTALGVAQRYATGLHPRAVWVCNHCDFRQSTSADDNHGTAWTHIHVADQFRPGNVPSAFAESVRAALALPSGLAQSDVSGSAMPDAPERGLVLVIDVTGSMRSRSDAALETVASAADLSAYRQFRAVLYSDHGNTEPLLVRKAGPFAEIGTLLDAIRPLPSGDGDDADEALEDAMQRCRELIDDIGPQDLLILTDAAPHPVSACPYHIDFAAELRALLDAGCNVRVANDWWAGGTTWNAFTELPGFAFAPLSALVSAAGQVVKQPPGSDF
jgi:hypothetical protein